MGQHSIELDAESIVKVDVGIGHEMYIMFKPRPATVADLEAMKPGQVITHLTLWDVDDNDRLNERVYDEARTFKYLISEENNRHTLIAVFQQGFPTCHRI
jgi:hypothetical protein